MTIGKSVGRSAALAGQRSVERLQLNPVIPNVDHSAKKKVAASRVAEPAVRNLYDSRIQLDRLPGNVKVRTTWTGTN